MDFDDSGPFPGDSRFVNRVLWQIKSGKEADVYCCEARPAAGVPLLAAKRYRPLENRGFRNDRIYQDGRPILDRRLQRAYRHKTGIGKKQQFNSWINAEYETLSLLHAAGAYVPRPYEINGDAIVMEYIGDAESPAPPLSRVRLSEAEAKKAFETILRQIKLMYENERIHSDLSAYNILYWQDRITIIDFPQAVDPEQNSNGFGLLLRDIENICDYFKRYGIQSDPLDTTLSIWEHR